MTHSRTYSRAPELVHEQSVTAFYDAWAQSTIPNKFMSTPGTWCWAVREVGKEDDMAMRFFCFTKDPRSCKL